MRAAMQVVVQLAIWGIVLAVPSKAQIFERVTGPEEINQIIEHRGIVWIAADNGLYRIDGGSLALISVGFQVNTVAAIEDAIWLGSTGGLYRVEGEEAFPMFRAEIGSQNITVITLAVDTIWVGTNRRLFQIQSDSVLPADVKGLVRNITEINDEVWVGTRGAVYRKKPDGPFESRRAGWLDASKIVGVQSSVWVIEEGAEGFPKAVLRFEEEKWVEFYPQAGEFHPGKLVLSLAEVGDEIWFATTQGVYRLSGQSMEKVSLGLGRETVNTIAALENGEVLIGTTKRAYRRAGDGIELISPKKEEIDVEGFALLGNSVWMWSSSGAYRLAKAPTLLSVEAALVFFFAALVAALSTAAYAHYRSK